MAIPNLSHVLEAVKDRYPGPWRRAHTEGSVPSGLSGVSTREQSELWIRLAAWECQKVDSRAGLNGKRGTDVLSQDVISFRIDDWVREAADVIGGAGGPNPTIVWNPFPPGDESTGKWIAPREISDRKVAEIMGEPFEPPVDPPVDPPAPPVGPMQAFRSFHGTLITFEQNTGRVLGDRTAVGDWEKGRIIRDPSTPGWGWIEDAFGHNLLTDDDGNVTFGRTDDQSRKHFGLWERDGKLSIQSGKTRKWLRMGSNVERFWLHFIGPMPQFEGDPNNEPGDYETFTVEDVAGQQPSGHPFPRGGGFLHARDNGWYVGDTHVNPIGVMAGDWLMRLSEGDPIVLQTLDACQEAGFDYVGPTWVNVGPRPGSNNPFWGNRAFSVLSHGRQGFKDWVLRFSSEVIRRQMRVFIAAAGWMNMSNQEETETAEVMAEVMSELGSEHFFHTLYTNEDRDTGDRDDIDPNELERIVNVARHRHPNNAYALSAHTGDTSREMAERYTRSWMKHAAVHGYRDGDYEDKLRHLQNKGYEEIAPVRTVLLNDEDFGPQGRNHHLSVQRNSHELDKHVMILAASIAAQTRTAYSFTCSPGILLDEDVRQIPGFMEIPGFLHRHVPTDLGTYQDLIHSGERWRGTRVFKAQNTLRVDGRVHHDGRFYFTAYAKPNDLTSEIELEKSAEFDLINTDEQVFHFSLGEGQRIPDVPVEKGYVLRGRLR